jgi:hypothetical protein
MSNDAKLGLVVGVGLVIVVAVVFFRPDRVAEAPSAATSAAVVPARNDRFQRTSRPGRQERPGEGVNEQGQPEQ